MTILDTNRADEHLYLLGLSSDRWGLIGLTWAAGLIYWTTHSWLLAIWCPSATLLAFYALAVIGLSD